MAGRAAGRTGIRGGTRGRHGERKGRKDSSRTPGAAAATRRASLLPSLPSGICAPALGGPRGGSRSRIARRRRVACARRWVAPCSDGSRAPPSRSCRCNDSGTSGCARGHRIARARARSRPCRAGCVFSADDSADDDSPSTLRRGGGRGSARGHGKDGCQVSLPNGVRPRAGDRDLRQRRLRHRVRRSHAFPVDAHGRMRDSRPLRRAHGSLRRKPRDRAAPLRGGAAIGAVLPPCAASHRSTIRVLRMRSSFGKSLSR
jgi:hypothetical protein